jgi:hypothetical protein
MTVRYKGELLSTEELQEVAENLIISKHAKQRIAERHPTLDVYNTILNPVIAFFNTDGTIYIGINKWEHLIIDVKSYGFKLVTIKQRSFTDVTIFDKRDMAVAGHWDKYRTEKLHILNKN